MRSCFKPDLFIKNKLSVLSKWGNTLIYQNAKYKQQLFEVILYLAG